MKNIFLTVSFLILCITTSAQHSIQSTVYDSKNSLPLEMATVRLLNPTDSSMVQGCRTDMKGFFSLKKIKPGNYILLISSVGYIDYKQKIIVTNRDLIMRSIKMNENAHLLSEVQVKGTAAQMVVKGDTMEFNATAFKTTQNAVVEDLLKRLPGVEVSSEGKITVNGEEVKKIRVNGKKFFGDDVEMATKNIPAELIDKVQVLEQKSDMAQLTGFEDNDTERIINLTFKENRKKGTFGNITAGGGSDTDSKFRYDNNLFLNLINGESQSTLTGGLNNTNTSRSTRGRGGFGNNSGITTTQNIGINNSSTVNNKLKFGGDASFNHSVNETSTNSNKESYLKELQTTQYNNYDTTNANNETYAANMRLEVEWKLDSLNTLVFQPEMNYNRGFSESDKDYNYLTNKAKTSWGNTSNVGNSTGIDGTLGVIFSHKLTSKKGRTFSVNLKSGISQNDNESYNKSDKYTKTDLTTIDQHTTNHSDKYNASVRLSYVEPLWNLKNFLETSVSFRTSKTESEKNQYNKDGINYSKLDSTYSNNFDNNFYSETLEFNYRYVDKIYNLMLGFKAEPSQTYSTTTYGDGDIRKNNNEVINYSPSARFQFNFGKKKFARIDYRGRTDQPSVNQMQPVKNNSNLMSITIGNPSLNPSFTHDLRMMYTNFNNVTFSSFNATIGARATKDALVANSIYDITRKQYTQTVNSKSTPFNFFGNVMFNTPIIQKRLHFNTNTMGSFEKQYGYTTSKSNIDNISSDSILPLGTLSSTRRYGMEEQLSLTFTHEVIEIGTRVGIKYSNTLNNLNPEVSKTTDWSFAGNTVIHLPYNINIGSDINYTTRQGYTNFDKNELIWNASIDKTLFKSKGVLALKATDILRQKLNISQTIGENYIQYNSYNTLRTYFILSFTYKINKFSGMKDPGEMGPGMDKFGPGDRPPRGDGRGGHGGHGGFGGGPGGPF